MLGFLASMALLRSRAGRTLIRCLAIVGILFVYNYMLCVKIIIAFLVISEIAALIFPPDTTPQPGRSSTSLLPDAGLSNYDETRTGPYQAPWSEQEGEQEEYMHQRLKDFTMPPDRAPTIVTAPLETSNASHASNRTGPRRSNRRQQEEIHRHLQRLAEAATAADEATTPANVFTSHYYSASMMGRYPDRVGGTFRAATLTHSNSSAAQVESTDFWTRNPFPDLTAPPVATQASSNHLRHDSRGLGHSKSLPDSRTTYNREDVYPPWKG